MAEIENLGVTALGGLRYDAPITLHRYKTGFGGYNFDAWSHPLMVAEWLGGALGLVVGLGTPKSKSRD